MRQIILAAAAAVLLAGAGHASAEDFPTKQVKMIVPFAPGGGNDTIGRLVAENMDLGQAIVVENREGAGGAVGLGALKQSAADGYTIATTSDGPIITNTALYDNLPYDPKTDFTPVALMSRSSVVLVANPKLGVKTVAELLALAREKPGKVSYASGGIGNYGHLATELLATTAGVQFLHAPYKGTAPAIIAALSGEVDFVISSPATVLEHVKAGTLVALGVGDATPHKLFPDAAPIADTVPGYQFSSWVGVIAPAGTPQERVNKLATAITDALKKDNVIARMEATGMDVAPLMPAEFGVMIESETVKWHQLIKDAGIALK